MATLTQDYMKELLSYDAETGYFRWRKAWGRRRMNVPAGCVNVRDGGYIVIGIDGVVHQAHRLAWLYMFGRLPHEQIDHINGDRGDNRLANLRECSHCQNHKNVKRPSHNTSGFKGVHFHPQGNKWRARIKSNGKHYSLGLYHSKEQAHAAYCAAAERFHGDFARFQ